MVLRGAGGRCLALSLSLLPRGAAVSSCSLLHRTIALASAHHGVRREVVTGLTDGVLLTNARGPSDGGQRGARKQREERLL